MGAEGAETENNKWGKGEKRGGRQPLWGDHGHCSCRAGARLNGGRDSEIGGVVARCSTVEAEGKNIDATVRPRIGGGVQLRRRRSSDTICGAQEVSFRLKISTFTRFCCGF
ncbi:choline dehydrogenase [Sesbania bispinosa]|nr:choline dehydrogenase [Sesbania bispinosa]